MGMEYEQAQLASSIQHQVEVEIALQFGGIGFSESVTRPLFKELNVGLFKKTLRPVNLGKVMWWKKSAMDNNMSGWEATSRSGAGDGSYNEATSGVEMCELIWNFGSVWFSFRVDGMEVPRGPLLLLGGIIKGQEIRGIREVMHGMMDLEDEFHSFEGSDRVRVTHSLAIEMKLLYVEVVDVGFVRVSQRIWKIHIRKGDYVESDLDLQRSLFPNSALRTRSFFRWW
ncbi:unnamed protein product [Linum trigynum]|uniref:Uncharacterized protein n=1 Tax=Linum trigynum TaxID=586398 RepID=A0AAV2GA22_9ROSI